MISKNSILRETAFLFYEKGIKFTVDDLAKGLNCSKKTIYTFYDSKDEIMLATVDYCFDDMFRQYDAILNSDLTCVQKLRQIVSVYPSEWTDDNNQVERVRIIAPRIYERIVLKMNENWEIIFDVLDDCIKQGKIKPIPHDTFKAIIYGISISVLDYNNQSKMLSDAMNFLFDGLRA